MGALAAAAAPAHAAPTWSDPVELGQGFGGKVLIDARGDVLATWGSVDSKTSTATAHYAWRSPRGTWSAPRTLPAKLRDTAQFAAVLTPRGDATVAWSEDGRIVSADARPGRALGNLQTVASDQRDAERPSLATDDEGNLVVAWTFHDCEPPEPRDTADCYRSTSVATRRSGGRWRGPHFTALGETAQAAVNPAGAAAVSFLAPGANARLAYRHPGGSFGAVEVPPVAGYGLADVAIDDAGRATLTTRSLSTLFGRQQARTSAAQRHPLVGWGEAGELPGGASIHFTLLAEPSGGAFFLTDQRRSSVTHAERRPDGSFDGPATLAADADAPSAAINFRGGILAAWHSPAAGSREAAQVFVADRSAGGAFETPQPVSRDPGAVDPSVALNDAGQAAAVWTQGTSTGVAVREDPAAGTLPFPPDVAVETPKAARLDSDGGLRLVIRCNRSCRATPTGILAVGGGDLRAAGGPTKTLKAGRRTGITLRLGAAAAKRVRQELKAGRRPWVGFTIRAQDDSPRPMTVTRRVRLR